MTSKQEILAQWLRDVHALEEQAKTMLEAQSSRISNYPELKKRIDRHLEETTRQEERIRGCLDRHGGPSAMKDAGGKLMATMQGLGGAIMGDEVVKGAMASFAFESFEIASYRSLIAAADACGDTDTRQVAEEILKEEEAMAAWLEDHLPAIVQQYLDRAEQGGSAKR